MLKVENLTVRYGGVTALNSVSITVGRGETILLVGANGAGKSSLINSVIGLTPRISGSIIMDGKPIDRLPCEQRAKLGIGYSPEGRRVFPSMSVKDNVLAGITKANRSEMEAVFEQLSTMFPLLKQRSDQPAGQLSGGQQQIVAIARAMSSKPSLLLLDEPFLGLAPVWIAQISDAIKEFQANGVTILMTEQMAIPALKLATRGYVVRGGRIMRDGTPAEIKAAALSNEYL